MAQEINLHCLNAALAALSSIGLPVLCTTVTLRTKPCFGSMFSINTPLPVMPFERASYGYCGRGA